MDGTVFARIVVLFWIDCNGEAAGFVDELQKNSALAAKKVMLIDFVQ